MECFWSSFWGSLFHLHWHKTVQSRVQEDRSYENHTRRLRLFERRWKVGTIGQRKHHDHAWRQKITKAWLPSLLWRVSSNFPFCMFSLCFWEDIMSWFVNCAGRVGLAQDELFRTLQTDQPTEQVFSKWKVHGNMHIDTRTVKLLLNRNPDFSSNHFILRSRETASSIGCLFEMLKPFRFYNSTPVWMLYSA